MPISCFDESIDHKTINDNILIKGVSYWKALVEQQLVKSVL
ncbi:hypothetical protein AACW90_09535 [Vibrio sp. F74]